MVGYADNDSLTPNQKLIAGCVSGFTTRFASQPLDVIKIQTQLQKKKPQRMVVMTKKIYNKYGFMAFWRGHNIGQIHTVIAMGSQFYVYEITTGLVHTSSYFQRPYLKNLGIFACGVFAGCAAAAVVAPMEVVRVHMIMAKDPARTLRSRFGDIYRMRGVLGFYAGLSASMIQMGPTAGITFAVFNLCQRAILKALPDRRVDVCKEGEKCIHIERANENPPENMALASTLAGGAAALVSKTVTYPFDLAKRRLQISAQSAGARNKVIKCRNITHCLRFAFKKEGWRGLYRGWLVTIYKAQITSIVSFTTYEIVCHVLREYNFNVK